MQKKIDGEWEEKCLNRKGNFIEDEKGLHAYVTENLASSYYFHTMEGKGGKLKSSSEYLRAFDLKLYMAHGKNSLWR